MNDPDGDPTSRAEDAHPSCIPGSYRLADSKKDVVALSVALAGLVLLSVIVWYEANH